MSEYVKSTVSQLVQVLERHCALSQDESIFIQKKKKTTTHVSQLAHLFMISSLVHLGCLCSLGSGLHTHEVVHWIVWFSKAMAVSALFCCMLIKKHTFRKSMWINHSVINRNVCACFPSSAHKLSVLPLPTHPGPGWRRGG